MPRWNARERQRVVDEYLNDSGNNHFQPREFLAWLKERPGHSLYDVFYGKSDERLATIMREAMVRHWISGCRLTVNYTDPTSTSVNVVVTEQPAYISAVAGRKAGGGYTRNDPSDPEAQAELARQAASALDSWLRRFRGIAITSGIDTTAIDTIVASLTAVGMSAETAAA